ncbi:TnsA endonuclease N-terminal domain-containing protein [Metabacillus fastidiosus]|nr:TnsA endonuclease N-terminal domain-containing protein [Metabacillus fastidiosus]
MAKRKNGWTEGKIAKYIAEGRGQGELAGYKPWLTIQDVPSHGRVHRLKGWKTQRIHQFMSDLECNYFYLLEWAENVIDIREQFPLDRERTTKIAEERDINHPIDKETKTPIVMTTDFIITIREKDKVKYLARTIKMSKELEHRRTIEKFEIERHYWEEQNIDWGIVTELDIPKIISKNILWVHGDFYINEKELELINVLYEELGASESTLLDVVTVFDEKYLLEKGTGLTLFKYLLARKYITIDMNNNFDVQVSVTDLNFDKEFCENKENVV